MPLCPLHAATGWWCPLCGGLRATQALSHGDVAAALHDNALLLGSLPLLVWWWVDWIVRARADRAPRVLQRGAGLVVVLVLVGFTVVRNLPGAEALRP